jgi:hypothetical protein
MNTKENAHAQITLRLQRLKILFGYIKLFRGKFTKRETSAFEKSIETLSHQPMPATIKAHRLYQLTLPWNDWMCKVHKTNDPLQEEICKVILDLTKLLAHSNSGPNDDQ